MALLDTIPPALSTILGPLIVALGSTFAAKGPVPRKDQHVFQVVAMLISTTSPLLLQDVTSTTEIIGLTEPSGLPKATAIGSCAILLCSLVHRSYWKATSPTCQVEDVKNESTEHVTGGGQMRRRKLFICAITVQYEIFFICMLDSASRGRIHADFMARPGKGHSIPDSPGDDLTALFYMLCIILSALACACMLWKTMHRRRAEVETPTSEYDARAEKLRRETMPSYATFKAV